MLEKFRALSLVVADCKRSFPRTLATEGRQKSQIRIGFSSRLDFFISPLPVILALQGPPFWVIFAYRVTLSGFASNN